MFKIAWHPIYIHPVPENHRFPMEKYELLPQQLVRQGIVNEDFFFEPTEGMVYDFGVHDADYLNKLFNLKLSRKEERASGFVLSRALVDREIRITNGSVEAAVSSLKHGVAFNIAGGTHHAFTNKAEGFSLINDQAVASTHLLKEALAKQILIVDLDVHQGNGTAQIFANEERVFTFSMHGAKNYPFHKPPSDLDIPLQDETTDREYLDLLTYHLSKLIKKVKPDFMFFLAGVDVLAEDKLGRLALTLEGCKARDEIVFNAARKHEIPVMVTMGGGYAPDIKTILEAHCNTFRVASDLFH
ncbi:MAG: histone deacetylase [Balneolales bacterium]|nr:histone deacetylase [Balneolales bacterium]